MVGVVFQVLQAVLTVVVMIAVIIALPFLFMIVFSFAYGAPGEAPPRRSSVAPPAETPEPDDDTG